MIAAWALLGVLALQGPAPPESVTSGNVRVRVPPGWKHELKEEGLFLRPPDLDEEDAFVVIVLPGRKEEGSLAEAFDRSWKQVVGRRRVISKAPERETRTESGVGGLMTVGLLETADETRVIATLAVFKPGDRAEGVLALTGQDRMMNTYREALGELLRHLRFRNVELPDYEILLWMPSGDPPAAPEVRVVWRDGSCRGAVPGEGMEGLDPGTARARFPGAWGTHETREGALRLRWGGREETLGLNPDGTLRSPEGGAVVRIPPSTGLRLEGRYGLWGAPAAPEAPSFLFKADGTLEDRGAGAACLAPGEAPADAAGPCRYEFANHTLFLAYPGERRARTSALVLPPARDAEAPALLLGGRWFRKN